MRTRDLNRTLLENILSRAMNEINIDSHRTARKLVDLGLLFAKDPFERHFFEICRQTLQNENSPYYTMISSAIQRFDRQSLMTFGLNLGLEGCSRGTRKIRELEAQSDFYIPWTLQLHAGKNALPLATAERVLAEADSLGIRCFFLWDAGLSQSEFEILLREFPKAAFIFMVDSENVGKWDLTRLSKLHNMMLSVSDSPELCKKLEAQHILYAAHVRYRTDDEPFWSQVADAAQWNPLFLFLFPDNAPEAVQKSLLSTVIKARSQQKPPFGLMIAPGDFVAIDRWISQQESFLSFAPNGDTLLSTTKGSTNIQNTSLAEILKKEFPKK